MKLHLLPLQPGGVNSGQAASPLYPDSNTGAANPSSTAAPGHRQTSRMEGSSRGLGVPARHPRRHTSYHNPIPSAWHTPPSTERQLSYGERTFGGWRDDWKDAGESGKQQQQQQHVHRNRRSDIGPESTDTSYHTADSAYHIGMGFGLDALRKKRRASSPARSRPNSNYEDTVDGAQSSQHDMIPSQQQQSARATNPVSNNSSSNTAARHRRSSSNEGLLDNSNVKSEGSSGNNSNSMSPSSHLTFRGVRSMKHGKSDKAYQEGMRKASSLTDLSTASSMHGDNDRHSRPGEDSSLYRSRSRESLPDDPASYVRRPVSDLSHFGNYTHNNTDLHYLAANHTGGDEDTDTSSNSKPKTFFETLRDSLLNPEPPKPKNYRYLKLAGIPNTKTIENYGTDVSITSNPKRTYNNNDSSSGTERQQPNATNNNTGGVHSINNNLKHGSGVRSSAGNVGIVVSSPSRNGSPVVAGDNSNNNRETSRPGGSSLDSVVTNSSADGGSSGWNANSINESRSRTTIATYYNHYNHRNDRSERYDDLHPLPSDDCFARKTLLHGVNNDNSMLLRGNSTAPVLRYVGTSGAVSGNVRRGMQEEPGRQGHHQYRAPPSPSAPQPARASSAVPTFAWEPRSNKITSNKGINNSTTSSSARGSTTWNNSTSSSVRSTRAPSATVHHLSQARHTTRSMTAPIPSPAGASGAPATSTGSAASRPEEWRSPDRGGQESPPPAGGSSTGSSESYEDYFCRSPSPNSFFLNGRNKNETDEHKVSDGKQRSISGLPLANTVQCLNS